MFIFYYISNHEDLKGCHHDSTPGPDDYYIFFYYCVTAHTYLRIYALLSEYAMRGASARRDRDRENLIDLYIYVYIILKRGYILIGRKGERSLYIPGEISF